MRATQPTHPLPFARFVRKFLLGNTTSRSSASRLSRQKQSQTARTSLTRPIFGTREKETSHPQPRFHRLTLFCLIVFTTLGLLESAVLLGAEPVYQDYVVAADHRAASKAGAEILAAGGNVVDAAVATSFALSVVRPSSCGIGGGGFMVIWDAKTHTGTAIDYRERAPKAATREMFQGKEDRPNSSQIGARAAGVPGTVAGLCFAHNRYGRLPLNKVLAPAIRLAYQGVAIDQHDIEAQQEILRQFKEHPDYAKRFATLHQKYLNGGKTWKLEDRFCSPQLEVLKRIAELGPTGFYAGPVADALLKTIRGGGGIWTIDDLQEMDAVNRTPLTSDYRDVRIVTMPPPSSGGVALIETLNIFTAYENAHPGQQLNLLGHNRTASIHLVTEALKHAFADRAEFLGDTDQVSVPVERLISHKYAKALAQRIDDQQTKPRKEYGRFLASEDGGTSHFSILDSEGNAVACTETINTLFGSLVVEPKYGIVLNNEMDDFAAVPGEPNVFGLLQSEANAIAPGKKPLSSMTPTIIVRDGRAVHVVGGSGGPRIISSTLQVILNLLRHKMPTQQAVAAPRFHHQWVPETLFLEEPLPRRFSAKLEQLGHQVKLRNNLAAVQAASADSSGLHAASDPRKGGRPAGR